MNNSQNDHNEIIMDQFTKQAVPFANIKGHSAEEATGLLIDMVNITKEDTVLDDACGPGLLACALAPYAKHVTGIDITPAMIESAGKLAGEKELSNVSWDIGNVTALPYEDSSFSVAVSRYSFHHFQNPETVLREMVRVVKPHGRVAVIDVFARDHARAGAYDSVEKLRDPSHVHTLTLEELQNMAKGAGLTELEVRFYSTEIELEEQLRASFPENENDKDVIRKAVIEDVGKNKLGWGAKRVEGKICLSYPIAVIAGEKP